MTSRFSSKFVAIDFRVIIFYCETKKNSICLFFSSLWILLILTEEEEERKRIALTFFFWFRYFSLLPIKKQQQQQQGRFLLKISLYDSDTDRKVHLTFTSSTFFPLQCLYDNTPSACWFAYLLAINVRCMKMKKKTKSDALNEEEKKTKIVCTSFIYTRTHPKKEKRSNNNDSLLSLSLPRAVFFIGALKSIFETDDMQVRYRAK